MRRKAARIKGTALQRRRGWGLLIRPATGGGFAEHRAKFGQRDERKPDTEDNDGECDFDHTFVSADRA